MCKMLEFIILQVRLKGLYRLFTIYGIAGVFQIINCMFSFVVTVSILKTPRKKILY